MNYAYKLEVNLNGKWRVYKLVVSPAGKAPRDFLDGVRPRYKNKVRIKRITNADEFMKLGEQVPVSVHDKSMNGKVEFDESLSGRSDNRG